MGTDGESFAEEEEGRASVEVVGVGDAEGLGQIQGTLGREYRVHRAAQAALNGEADFVFFGPARGDVLFDLRTGFGVDHDDDVFESRGPRVRGQEIDDALAVLADGC